jgi:hypothetical protein
MVQDCFNYAEKDHETFAKNGYYFSDDFLTPEALRFLRARFDEVQSSLAADVHPYAHCAHSRCRCCLRFLENLLFCSEWVLGLHQFLPRTNNWIWHLATEPKLLVCIMHS